MGNQQVSLVSLREVPTLNNYYIDNSGNIYSTKRNKLPKKLTQARHKVSHSNKTYLRVKMEGRLWLAHRIIAMVKYGRVLLAKETINHIDGITTNNLESNLEIATHAEQVAHAVQTNLYCSGDDWYKARGLTQE